MSIIEFSFVTLCVILFILWTVFTLVEDKKVRDNLKQFLTEKPIHTRRELAKRKKAKIRRTLFSKGLPIA